MLAFASGLKHLTLKKLFVSICFHFFFTLLKIFPASAIPKFIDAVKLNLFFKST